MTGSPKSGKTWILLVIETGQSQGSITNCAGIQQGNYLRVVNKVGNVIGKAFCYFHIQEISSIYISTGSFEIRTYIFVDYQSELV